MEAVDQRVGIISGSESSQVERFATRMARLHLMNELIRLERTVNVPYPLGEWKDSRRERLPKSFSIDDPSRIASLIHSSLSEVVSKGNKTLDVQLDPDHLIVSNPVTGEGLYLGPNLQPREHPFINTFLYRMYDRIYWLDGEYDKGIKDGTLGFEQVYGDASSLMKLVEEQARDKKLTYPIREVPLHWTDLVW